MSLEKIKTSLEGYETQFISQKLDALTKTYYLKGFNGSELERIAGKIDGFSKMDRPNTDDGYTWFWGLHYKFGDGQVAVLFPWNLDSKKTDRVRSDRAIGVYYHGKVSVQQIDALLEKLYDAYVKDLEETARLAEQNKKFGV